MRPHDLWFSPEPGPRLARAVLTPASWLYALGWQSYLALYRAGLKRSKEPHPRVLCVGNLTVGGSGKTPLVLHLYELLKEMGQEVVVSCSGYGSEGQRGAALAPEGELTTSLWGDEAAMLRWLSPGMKLVVGRDRVQAAQIVKAQHPNSILLLDDGFQHLPLRKHFSIILDEAEPPNARCLPAGPYREPRANRKRADLVIPGEFRIEETPLRLLDSASGEQSFVERAHVLCAIGRPDRFLNSLREAGVAVESARTLEDHDPMDAGTLFAGFNPDLPVIVTAKDWVKLRRRSDLARWRIVTAMRDIRVEPAGPFRELLHATLKTP